MAVSAGRNAALWILACALLDSAGTAAVPDSVATSRRLSALATPFVPNAGQWDGQAAFAAHLSAGLLFVTTDGQLVYRLPGLPRPESGPDYLSRHPHLAHPGSPGWVLTETLTDAAGRTLHATPHGYGALEGKVSYAIGNDKARHRDGLPTYERVTLGDVYSGISVQFRAAGNNVEKIFTIAPAHDPAAIRIRLAGADWLAIGDDGELIAHTGNGPVVYTPPVAYQAVLCALIGRLLARWRCDGCCSASIFG